MVLRACKAKEGSAAQNHQRSRHVLAKSCIAPLLLRLSSLKEANLVGLASFLLLQTRVDIPCYARHSVHNAPDSAKLSPLGFMFYKLPPKDGVAANVGSPLTKTFLITHGMGCSWAQERMRMGPSIWTHNAATGSALVTDSENRCMAVGRARYGYSHCSRVGIILPQVITMAQQYAVWSSICGSWWAMPRRIMLAWSKGDGTHASGEHYCWRGCWFGGTLNLGVLGDTQFGLHGTMVLGWSSTDEFIWCNGTCHFQLFINLSMIQSHCL